MGTVTGAERAGGPLIEAARPATIPIQRQMKNRRGTYALMSGYGKRREDILVLCCGGVL